MLQEISQIGQDNSKRMSILRALKSVLLEEPNVAVFYSSLFQFRAGDTSFPTHLVAAISYLVENGWTILLPSFTFSFCSGKAFDKYKSPSETGILADLIFNNLIHAKRTNHPIYSFVVVGPQSDEVLSLQPKTTFGDGSPFEWVEKVDASIVLVGCGWESCTQFHRYEELGNVEYRYFKNFTGMADCGHGMEYAEAKMCVRDLQLKPENDFSEAFLSLKSKGKIKKYNLFNGTIEAVKVSDLRHVCKQQLDNDPFVYLSNKNEVRKKIQDKSERNSQQNLTISVLGNKNLELMTLALEKNLTEHIPERRFEFLEIPYGQFYSKLINKNDLLWTSSPNIRVFCDRLEDVRGVDLDDEEKTLKAVAEYAQLILNYHQSVGGWSIIHLFCNIDRPVTSSQTIEQNNIISRSNAILKDKLGTLGQLAWVDINLEISTFSGTVADRRLSLLGQFPWSEGFSNHLAQCWAGLIITMLGKDARIIVVDLDNTLWGGILGEDGIEGIKIGGDFPGNAFKAFQEEILKHSRRGVALALASKNDEDLALNAISKLPDMMIREKNLQAHAINWEPKWLNIKKICEELNLGLGSVLFIDDNPVEQESVKRNLPDVKVLALPEDPADYVTALQSSVYLRAITINKEDLGRIQDFSVRKQRASIKAQSTSMEDYYAALNITLTLNPLGLENAQRAAQLCQKTNQFNSTTRRYDQKQLFDLVASGADVVLINYQDKFSPPENIGLLIIKYSGHEGAIIDLYLLSCRVLGRGIETLVPKCAAIIACERGYGEITGEIIISNRNTPVRDVFNKSGFSLKSEGLWVSPTNKFEIPAWLEIANNLREECLEKL